MRIALEHADVSVGEMADALGCDRNTVGNYLAGRTVPRLPTIKIWALRCGVPHEWILTGAEPADGDDDGPGLEVRQSASNDDTPATVIPLKRAA